MKISKIVWVNEKQKRIAQFGPEGHGGPGGPQPMGEDEAIERMTQECSSENKAIQLAANIMLQDPSAGLTLLGITLEDGKRGLAKAIEKKLTSLPNNRENKQQAEEMKKSFDDPNALSSFLKALIMGMRTVEDFKQTLLPALGLSPDLDYLQRIKENIPILIKGTQTVEQVTNSSPAQIEKSKGRAIDSILDSYNRGDISEDDMKVKINSLMTEFANRIFGLKKKS